MRRWPPLAARRRLRADDFLKLNNEAVGPSS
jgi:hypothetical protein